MKRKQRSMNKLRTLHKHNHMRIWYKQVDKDIPRFNLRKLAFRALALRQSEKTFVIKLTKLSSPRYMLTNGKWLTILQV